MDKSIRRGSYARFNASFGVMGIQADDSGALTFDVCVFQCLIRRDGYSSQRH